MTAPPLFSAKLLPSEGAIGLPDGYVIRPLCEADYELGFLDVLGVLTSVGDISRERWGGRYTELVGAGGYYIVVIVESGLLRAGAGKERIVGVGTLVAERKFIHDLGLVGHIEDIAVLKDQQGKKLGLKIIQTLDFVAENVGCYKSILDCSEANEGFYDKCGFKRAGLEMAHYYKK